MQDLGKWEKGELKNISAEGNVIVRKLYVKNRKQIEKLKNTWIVINCLLLENLKWIEKIMKMLL
mgnify:CR=1 FL=1